MISAVIKILNDCSGLLLARERKKTKDYCRFGRRDTRRGNLSLRRI